MPSAEELRAITEKYNAEEDFIQFATRCIELAARSGGTYEHIDIPCNLTKAETKKILIGNFPNCRISSWWWANYFKVSWNK